MQVEERERWSYANGLQTVLSYEGPEADLTAFLSTELPAGYSEIVTTKSDGGQWVKLDITFSAAVVTPNPGEEGLVTRNWTLHRQEEQHPIMSHPDIMGDKTTIGLADLDVGIPSMLEAWADIFHEAQRDYIKQVGDAKASAGIEVPEWQFFKPAFKAKPSWMTPTRYAELEAISNEAFKSLCKNTNATYTLTVPILKKTEVVVSFSAMRANHFNVNRVLTHSTLCGSEPTLPTAALIYATGLSGYHWLKKSPQVDQVNAGQYQITQEFQGITSWSQWLYNVAL